MSLLRPTQTIALRALSGRTRSLGRMRRFWMPVTPWSKHDLGEVPEEHFSLPLGQAVVRKAGSAVTVLAYGTMVYVAEAAAKEMRKAGAWLVRWAAGGPGRA